MQKIQNFRAKMKIPLLFIISRGSGGCLDHLVNFLDLPGAFEIGLHCFKAEILPIYLQRQRSNQWSLSCFRVSVRKVGSNLQEKDSMFSFLMICWCRYADG